MAKEPREDEAEIEVICPRCGYHLRRATARLGRDTSIVCPNCAEQVVPPRQEPARLTGLGNPAVCSSLYRLRSLRLDDDSALLLELGLVNLAAREALLQDFHRR